MLNRCKLSEWIEKKLLPKVLRSLNLHFLLWIHVGPEFEDQISNNIIKNNNES